MVVLATVSSTFGKGANGFRTRGATGLGAGLIAGLVVASGLVEVVLEVVAGFGALAIKGIFPASTPVPEPFTLGAGGFAELVVVPVKESGVAGVAGESGVADCV